MQKKFYLVPRNEVDNLLTEEMKRDYWESLDDQGYRLNSPDEARILLCCFPKAREFTFVVFDDATMESVLFHVNRHYFPSKEELSKVSCQYHWPLLQPEEIFESLSDFCKMMVCRELSALRQQELKTGVRLLPPWTRAMSEIMDARSSENAE